MPNDISYGKIAYEAYRTQTGGKSTITGLGIPHWESMSDETKAAWEAAGKAVVDTVALLDSTPIGDSK